MGVSGHGSATLRAPMKRIAIISTGGTIEKTYCALAGVLANRVAVLDVMLAQLDLRGVSVSRMALMNKDSLDMVPEDHALIAATVHNALRDHDGVVVVHGTDRMAVSGEAVFERLARAGALTKPVVFTGSMKPYELRDTDAQQNLTEALLAVQILSPGVYVVMQNQVLAFPGVTKDHARGTFVKS